MLHESKSYLKRACYAQTLETGPRAKVCPHMHSLLLKCSQRMPDLPVTGATLTVELGRLPGLSGVTGSVVYEDFRIACQGTVWAVKLP